jgi:hypothetical protein
MDVTANAAGDATVEGLGDVQASVTSSGASFVVALGNLSGPVNAGTDAELFAGGTLDADLSAAGDATIEAIGDVTGTASAGQNLEAATYGDLNPSNFYAGQDVTIVWARGDISGSISAGASIGQVESYGSIHATFTAPTIGAVSAFGPIGGAFNASSSIGSLASGGAITATLNSPSPGTVSPFQHGLLTDWPATPSLNDAAEVEATDEARAELDSLAGQMTAEKSAALAGLPADKAAAAPSYLVSIGDVAAATAWFQNEAIQLAAQIAAWQAADQQSLTAAQSSLKTFFANEDVRLAAAKLGDQQYFTALGGWLAQYVADREAVAADDEQVAADALQAAQLVRTSRIAELDHTRDYDWPIMFEQQLRTLMLDRLQFVLSIVGIFEPGVADGINALVSGGRLNLLDAGINLFSIIPYGDLAKLLKAGKGLGKYADDTLAALRHVAPDFVNMFARGLGYANSCEAAAAFGLVGKLAQKIRIVGCFVGGTDAGGWVRVAVGEPVIAKPQSSAELEASGMDLQRLFGCFMVTMAAGGWLLSNRALRKKDEREPRVRGVTDLMFHGEGDEDLRFDGEPLEILARRGCVSHPEGAVAFAHAEVMKSLAFDDSPKVAGTGYPRAGGVPSPFAALAGDSIPALPHLRSESVTKAKKDFATEPNISRKRANGRTPARRRQSRFGLAWVIACLSIAAISFFSAPSRPVKPAAPVVATVLPASTAEEPRYELRMKPIEEYRLGERFIAINPLGAEDEPEPDPTTWKSVEMRMRKPSGKYVAMGLLLSPEKMEQFGVGRSPAIDLELSEMGLSGKAEVLSIGPCPEIEPGEGSVVTGIFSQESEGNLVNVFFEGRAEPLGVTDNHLFHSLDRGDFVSAGELRLGELLSSAYDGVTARVARVDRRPADELVYNLQVNGHHVYHVGPLAVLVHNACAGLPTKYGIEGIYEFTVAATGTTYVGQSNDILRRLLEHMGGKLDPSMVGTIIYRPVSGGKLAREIAEQFRILDLGGIRRLENKRNPIRIFGLPFP